MKLHAQLENTLKIRINSNDEIIPALKKLSELGKFDKPKELALFAIVLDRLGKLEDEAAIQDSLKNDAIESISGTSRTTYDDPNAPKENTAIEEFPGLDPLPEDGINIDVAGGQSGNPPPNAVVSEELAAPIAGDGSGAQGSDETIANTPKANIEGNAGETELKTEDAATVSNFNLDTIVDKPQEENPS